MRAITVLSKDIMTVPEDEIPIAQVLYTIVGGTIQYALGGGARRSTGPPEPRTQ
jgi:hypothetical protein